MMVCLQVIDLQFYMHCILLNKKNWDLIWELSKCKVFSPKDNNLFALIVKSSILPSIILIVPIW